MYCRCPHCDKQQSVSAKQLRERRALLTCKSCGQPFDALPSLSETKEQVVAQEYGREPSFAQAKKSLPGWVWGTLNGLMGMVLIGQVVYFDGLRVYQEPHVYSALAQACSVLNCRLPAANNPEDWSVSHSDLQAGLNSSYVLTAALTNQAQVPQAFPELKLILSDFNGLALAERILAPQQYADKKQLAADDTFEIRLAFVMSSGQVGGFTLTTL